MAYYNNQGQGYYPQQQNSNSAPQVPPPWVAEWDNRDNCWIYVNRETGQRTFEFPHQPYGGNNYGGGYGQQYQGGDQRGSYQQEPPKQSHTGRNVALGAAAGLIGGALLMHEGHKVGM